MSFPEGKLMFHEDKPGHLIWRTNPRTETDGLDEACGITKSSSNNVAIIRDHG